MQLALIVEADSGGGLGLRDPALEKRLRQAHAAMGHVRVRRQADLVSKRATQVELVEPRVGRELVERDRLGDPSVEHGASARHRDAPGGRAEGRSARRTPEEAAALLGMIGRVLAIDLPASSALTQERLGWRPTGPGLMEDLEKGHYFDA